MQPNRTTSSTVNRMKKPRKIIASLAFGMLWVSSCGSSSTEIGDPSTANESSDDIEVDEGLLSTEIRVPLDLFTAGTEGDVIAPTEEELQASVDAEGFAIDVTISSDNYVTYRMSRSEFGRFQDFLRSGIDETIQESINSESSIYKSVTYSDDLRDFKVVVNRSELEKSFSFFGFSILLTATLFQAFMGVGESDRYVVIRYIDEQTNEEFEVSDSREIEN